MVTCEPAAGEAVSSDDWQCQLDEIQALSSIFEDNFEITRIEGIQDGVTEFVEGSNTIEMKNQRLFHALEGSIPTADWKISCQLVICVAVAGDHEDQWTVEVSTPQRPLSDNNSYHTIKHLSPVILSFELTRGYPSVHHPQQLNVTSVWLSKRQAESAVFQLTEKLWAEQRGVPIVWAWADWIQNSLILHLSQNTQSQRLNHIILDCDDDGSTNEGCTIDAVLLSLLRYSVAHDRQLFLQCTHTCGICLEDYKGESFTRLDCSHAFCTSCLKEQARLSVIEGRVDALKCPDPECSKPLEAHTLRRHLLSKDLYERWEQLVLQRAFDQMSDAAYCPRCSTLSLEDTEENTADCPKCFYVFCTLCQEGRHPAVQCVSPETKLAMLKQKALGGGSAAVAELRKKEHELMSLATIEKSTKPCPVCGMAIERSEGCNKMTCTQCASFFCYKCGKHINGYDHFKAGGDCVLFDEAEILRWERRWEEEAGLHAAAAAFRNDYLLEFGDGVDHNNINNGAAIAPVANCPQCGQPNYRFARNNHLQCWSCTRHFCALCRTVLPRRGGGSHFGPNKCPQHSR